MTIEVTNEDELKALRDEARGEMTLQAIKDLLWRFSEHSEGGLSVYDLLGFLAEDLIKEGFCPACLNDLVQSACERTATDPTEHREEGGAPGEAVH